MSFFPPQTAQGQLQCSKLFLIIFSSDLENEVIYHF